MASTQLTPIPATILERTLGMPAEGPKCVPVTLDFSAADTYNLDYSNMARRGFMQSLQTVWVDNSLNGDPVSIIIPASQQTVKIPANTQGYYCLICPNPIKISFTSAGAAVVTVLLLNFPVALQQR